MVAAVKAGPLMSDQELLAENLKMKAALAYADMSLAFLIDLVTEYALVMRHVDNALAATHPEIAAQAEKAAGAWETFIGGVVAANGMASRQTSPGSAAIN